MRHCKTRRHAGRSVCCPPARPPRALCGSRCQSFSLRSADRPRLRCFGIVSRQPYRPFNRKPNRAPELIWRALELRQVATAGTGEGKPIEIIIRLKVCFHREMGFWRCTLWNERRAPLSSVFKRITSRKKRAARFGATVSLGGGVSMRAKNSVSVPRHRETMITLCDRNSHFFHDDNYALAVKRLI